MHLERNLRGESVTMMYDWLTIITIPTIQLNTPAALQQYLQHKVGFTLTTYILTLKSVMIM